jgi:hypothetical protein
MTDYKSDIEIARAAEMKPIDEILAKIKVPDSPVSFSPMGRHIAKLNFEYMDKLKETGLSGTLIFAKISSIGFISAALAISISDFTPLIGTPIYKKEHYVYII